MLLGPAVALAADGVVNRSATCGCCHMWAEAMNEEGLTFEENVVSDSLLSELKLKNGVPVNARACHTAEIEGYVIEGHVPASAIRQLLEEKPDIAGLVVPGMPPQSPGMGGPLVEYEVLKLHHDGSLTPWLVYQGSELIGPADSA